MDRSYSEYKRVSSGEAGRPEDLSAAALYGSGIFTTLRIRDSTPFLWEKHWRRLEHNALTLGIDLSDFSEEATHQAVEAIIRENEIVHGRIRITFSDQRPSDVWSSDRNGEVSTRLTVISGGLRPHPERFTLAVSPYPINSRSPLAGVKSCNYLENLMAREEACKRGSDEAVRLNELGHVTSACMANIFWLAGERLYTPSLAAGCLSGTTREFVLENIEATEIEAGIDALANADAVFLTSAGLGVVAASRFDERTLPDVDHPIMKILPK